jgi:hypothetical protein
MIGMTVDLYLCNSSKKKICASLLGFIMFLYL